VTLTCHPEAQPKDLANEKEILRFAQNDSFAVTLGTLVHLVLFRASDLTSSRLQLIVVYLSERFKNPCFFAEGGEKEEKSRGKK